MLRKKLLLLPAVLAAIALLPLLGDEAQANRGHGALGVVYVTSQGLYYDTFVTAQQLPPHGPFQLLVGGATQYGPGDRQYVGGRWKMPDGDGGYKYFLCPLLGPGRTSP